MRRRSLQIIFGAVAMAAAVVTGALPASAAPITPSSWTVSPGGTINASSGQTTLTDAEDGTQLICESSRLTNGSLVTSASGSPARLGTLQQGSVSFQNCSGPFGLTFEVTQVGDWYLNGKTYDPATGVTVGNLTNVVAHLDGFACHAVVEGSQGASHSNSTHGLTPDTAATLTITYVDPDNDCLGVVVQGHHVSYEADYTITPGQTVRGS